MADREFTVPDEFSEAYEVVRTFEVYTPAGQRYRFEIVRALRGRTHEFCAHYYVESVDGIWTELTGVPWVAADDLDFATHQALGWLRDYANSHKRGEQ